MPEISLVDELRDTIKWMAQSVHQAHHRIGTYETCGMGVCVGAREALSKREHQYANSRRAADWFLHQ